MSANVATSPGRSIPNRWALLAAGVISMITIANLQYAWAVFVNPMAAAHKDWSLVAIQGVYASFILVETWLVPFEAYLVDRFGPRIIISIGAVLVGLSWLFSGMSTTSRCCTHHTWSAASVLDACTAPRWVWPTSGSPTGEGSRSV